MGEKIMREVEEPVEERPGKVIGGRSIWNNLYADDTTMVAKTREKCSQLQMGEVLIDVSRMVGLDRNKNKTLAMNVHGEGDVAIVEESINNVHTIKFLRKVSRFKPYTRRH